MLTRELLLFRTREGRLRPSFVRRDDAALVALAQALLAELQDAVGRTREELEEMLALHAGAFQKPKVARGLVKLLLDRMDFGEPEPEVGAARAEALRTAARVLRTLPPDATPEHYAAQLAAALPRPLEEVRAQLYADLPPQRRLVALELPADAGELLDRYNLALAQGHLLGAKRLHLRARAPELLRVRKVLRWLKFCRLVAQLHREDEDWELSVEGPGAMLDLQKKYGLQLASFLTAVPLLQRWELRAEVTHGRRTATLVLDHEDPLVSPHAGALGHVPEEVAALARALEEDSTWALELTPLPRHTGAAGLCVPDLTLRHRESGREVALELFHAWHAGALRRRLEELRARPDPDLLLGVERALVRDEGERAVLEAHPQVLLFRGYPSPKKLRAWLAREPGS